MGHDLDLKLKSHLSSITVWQKGLLFKNLINHIGGYITASKNIIVC
jgi:hypothetical protein